MKRSIYQDQLKNLESQLAKLPDSKLGFRIKVLTMLLVAMRFEPHLFNTSLDKHPYLILKEIILDAQKVASIFSEILFLEDLSNSNIYNESKDKEKKHRDLFNVIWNKFNKNDFDNYIKIYVKRIKINNLSDFIKEKRCIDLGSGNGVFCFALLECGAKSVVGLDFGEHNTKFASEIAKLRGISDRAEFVTRSVYETGFNDGNWHKVDITVNNLGTKLLFKFSYKFIKTSVSVMSFVNLIF